MSLTYCYNCGRLTGGDPLFCGTCGRSYDVKLCPRLHKNPRTAEVCSQCGSRELSTPQPKVPMSWRLLAILARLGLGVLLFYASLSVLIALLQSPKVQQGLIALVILLALLWWLWTKLPDWFQELIRSVWKWRRQKNDHD